MFFFEYLCAFQSQFATSYSTTTTYSIGSIIPHFRVKNLFFVNLTVVDHYPVIKLVPLDL